MGYFRRLLTQQQMPLEHKSRLRACRETREEPMNKGYSSGGCRNEPNSMLNYDSR